MGRRGTHSKRGAGKKKQKDNIPTSAAEPYTQQPTTGKGKKPERGNFTKRKNRGTRSTEAAFRRAKEGDQHLWMDVNDVAKELGIVHILQKTGRSDVDYSRFMTGMKLNNIFL